MKTPPGGHLAQGIDLAPEGDLGRGDELGIPGTQGIFLLHILHQLRGKGLGGHLRVDEGHLAVLLLKLGTEGTLKGGLRPGLEGRLELGHLLIVEGHLRVIEFVTGVDIPANLGQGAHGVELHGGQLCLPVDGIGLLKGPGGLEPGGQVLGLGLPLGQVGSLIG